MLTTNHANALAHVERVLLAGLSKFEPEHDRQVEQTTGRLIATLGNLLDAGEVKAWQLLELSTASDVNQFLADHLRESGDCSQAEYQQQTLASQRLRLMELVWPEVGLQSAGEIDREICAAVEAGRIAVDDLREPQTAEDVVALLRRIEEEWGA